MEIQASHLAARVGADGALVPLSQQNRSRWDQLLIQRRMEALARAMALGDDGPYALQAALAACHARARTAAEADWHRIALLYDRLSEALPSPVVHLNRVVAHSMASGPEAGLRMLADIADVDALRNYAPLAAARGDFMHRCGQLTKARAEFERAAQLTRNERERSFLLDRANARSVTR